MKTDILKMKVVVIAFVIVSSAQSARATTDEHLLTHEQYHQGMSDIKQLSDQEQHEQQFIESMFLQIRGAVKAIAELIESFIDKNNKESFSAFIARCQARINHIEKNILEPLKKESLEALPGSNYHKILELTFKLAHEMAYKELQTLHTILDTHRKSDKAKSAMALVSCCSII